MTKKLSWKSKGSIYMVAGTIRVSEILTRQKCRLTGTYSFEACRTNPFEGNFLACVKEANRREAYILKCNNDR